MIDEKLVFTNKEGRSIELGNKEPYILMTVEGLGSTTVDNQTQKAPYQDGKTLIDSLLEPRELFITLLIKTEDQETLYEKRQEINEVINPKKGPFSIKHVFAGNEKEVQAVVEDGPNYMTGEDNRGPTFQVTEISLLAPDPFFYDILKTGETMGILEGGLTFPLLLNKDNEEHTLFARRGYEVLMENKGDVPTPVYIEFYGAAENPIVMNNTTGEFIKVNKILESDEKLIINTAFGNKKVELIDGDGNRENAFNYIDLDSTFWQLQTGANMVDFDSDIDKEFARVYVSYKNRYLGV